MDAVPPLSFEVMRERVRGLHGRPVRPAEAIRPDDHPGLREMVVAAYREDLTWLRDVHMPVTVYSKEPANRPELPGVLYVPQENRGREASAYLKHMINRYDSLAEWTYFVQGGAMEHVPDLLGRLDVPYSQLTSLTAQYLPDIPSPEVKETDRVEHVGGFEVRYADARFFGDRPEPRNNEWLASIWAHWMAGPEPDDWRFGYAAMWAVPRRCIIARPRGFWEWALEQVCLPEHEAEVTKGSAWALEALWLYLWGSPRQWPTRWETEDLQGSPVIRSHNSLYGNGYHGNGVADSFVMSRAIRTDVSRTGDLDASIVVYRQLWGELHRRALAFRGDVAAEQEWLVSFGIRIPCGVCRQEWYRMMVETPPIFASSMSYFEWTVDRHNEINVRIGNQYIKVEDAINIWILT